MSNDIKYDIIADATRFGNGVRSAERDAKHLQSTVIGIGTTSSRSAAQFQNSTSKMGQAVGQLAYGVEDAVSVFGTMGLAGALRASSNNMSGIAMSMGGPWAVAATVLGTSVAALAIKYFEAGSDAKTSANDIGLFTDRLKAQQEQIKENIRFQQKLADIRTTEKAGEERKSLTQDIEQRAAAIEDLKRQARNLEGVIENARQNNAGLDQEYGFVGQWMFGAGTKNEEEQLKKLRELLNQEEQEIGKARARMSQIKEETPQIQAREEQDKAAKQAKKDLDDQKKLAEELANESMTDQDRYLKRMKEIQTLRDSGKITEEQSAKYAKFAADQLEKQVQSQKESNQLLAGAMDIRSAEAYGVIAKAEAMAFRPTSRFTLPQLPQAPKPAADLEDPNVAFMREWRQKWLDNLPVAPGKEKPNKAEEETAQGIKRIGDILERTGPAIPVVGLN